MLQKDFQPNENQYDAAKQLGVFLKFWTKGIADFYAHYAKHEGGEADERHRRPKFDLDASKRNAHSQSVNAGGDSQEEHGLEV